MTKGVLFFLALLPLFFLPSPSWAATKTHFKADVTAVRAGCSKGGGSFQPHMDGKGYGCSKANCDGKGGDCHVACDNNNNCVGSTPARVDVRTGIVSVINNGWNQSTASESGGSDGGGGRDTSGSGSTGASGGGDKDTAGGNNHAGDNHTGPSAGNNNDNGGGGGVIY